MFVRPAKAADAAAFAEICLGILGETDYLMREPDEFNASPEASIAAIEKANGAEQSMLRIAVDDYQMALLIKS